MRDIQREDIKLQGILERMHRNALTIAEQKKQVVESTAAIRKAEIGMAQGEMQVVQQRIERTEHAGHSLGSMRPWERKRAAASVKTYLEAKDKSVLQPHVLADVGAILPGLLHKDQMSLGAKSKEMQSIRQHLGKHGLGDELGDLTQMHRDVQVKAADIHVKLELNEKELANKIQQALKPVFDHLLQRVLAQVAKKTDTQKGRELERNANLQ